MNSTGIMTWRPDDSVMETVLNPGYSDPGSRRRTHALAHLHMPHDIFKDDDRVIPAGKIHRERQRHHRQVVERIPTECVTASVPASENGNARTRKDWSADTLLERGRVTGIARKSRQLNGKFPHPRARGLRVGDRANLPSDVHSDRRRKLSLRLGQQRFYLIDHLHRVHARLAEKRKRDRTGSVVPGQVPEIFDVIDHMPEIGKPHGRAVPVSDDKIFIVGRIEELTGCLDGRSLPASPAAHRWADSSVRH